MERDLTEPERGQDLRLTLGSWDRMRTLLALRAEQGELSVIERRIAEHIVEKPLSVRDQSSQQLATMLGVSQSSVVKFAKRLGFRGYPDMKLSISEALARDAVCNGPCVVAADPDVARAEALTRGKAAADDETRAVNPPDVFAAAARWLIEADTLFIAGEGGAGLAAQAFAAHVAGLGRRCIVQTHAGALRTSLLSASAHDALVMVSDQGEPAWLDACRGMRDRGGGTVVVARQRTGAWAAVADACLVVSAQASDAHVAELIHQSALRQLLDDLFLRMLAARDAGSSARSRGMPHE